jgi:WXXGXW repeat (2 copies)
MHGPKHFLVPIGVISVLALTGCVVQVPAGQPVATVAVDEASAPPPPLPVYEQPPCPGDGYIWTPGYWHYSATGYYWVPGTWVRPPAPGLLWTPGYWAAAGGSFRWHDGYWGTHVGFYGGVNYGHGYAGSGYEGGRWDHGHFAYNTAVNNVNTTVVHNTYVKTVTVVNVTTVTNVSYNGGSGGTVAQPSKADLAYAREAHRPPTDDQARHVRAAATDPAFRAAENHGRPAVAATARPSDFRGPGVVPAHAAPERHGPDEHPADAQHPNRGPAAQGGPMQDRAPPQAAIHPLPPGQDRAPPQASIRPLPPGQDRAPPQASIRPLPPGQDRAPPQAGIHPAPPGQDRAAPQAAIRPAQDDKAAPNAHRPVPPMGGHPPSPAAPQKQKPEDKKAKQHDEHEPQKN